MQHGHLYFAYGSNLSVAQMQARCPASEPWREAHLPGYRLAFGNISAYRGGGVATVVAQSGTIQTPGLIYRLTESDLEKLDRWESYPKKYDRFRVQVVDSSGAGHEVWTYRLNEYYPNAPSAAYLKIIEAGYIAQGWELEGLRAALEFSNGHADSPGANPA